MKHFAALFSELDQTTKTNTRIAALVQYMQQAEKEDLIWMIALLAGKRPRRMVQSNLMKEWIRELAAVPEWLFEESYQVVGDMSETISLLLPEHTSQSNVSLHNWMNQIIGLKAAEEEEKKAFVVGAWKALNRRERFVFNKLIGGSFRIGVSQKTMIKALAKFTGRAENELAHRLMGNWDPAETTFHELVVSESTNQDNSKPYPFYLAYALDEKSDFEADPTRWQVERKWDGIRGQLIVRGGELFVWSRGEELVTDKYPEFASLAEILPEGTVLDGEILPMKDGIPLPFSELQKRIGRKNVGKKLLQEVPVVLVAYDCLEHQGMDIRNEPLSKRRKFLEDLVENNTHESLQLSPMVDFQSLEDLSDQREQSREHYSEGLMLKRKDSIYQVGRKRGDWWKWKVDPLVIDAVLIYAMRGHGRRANLYTDYTFAVWKDDQLVPFTKAYSGLTDEEFRKVDRFVKTNIIEKFGPVRSVKPELVFEIAFEGIAKSSRHKSGISLRFPRMSRWRQDKKPEDANTLQDLEEMLATYG